MNWYKKALSMTVCTIVLHAKDVNNLDGILGLLGEVGASVDNIDTDNGVLDCTVESEVISSIEHSGLFSYIRKVFCYQKDGEETPLSHLMPA